MKCNDCLKPIPKSRGYCVSPACHNKMIGGPSPEKGKALKSWQRTDKKRCPFCAGDEGRGFVGKCYISACDRGLGGKSCSCHYMFARMGPLGQEMRVRQWARTVA